jgi:hypothetical protein
MRAALVAGAVAVLGVAVTPAVAAVYHRSPPVGPVTVATEPRGDGAVAAGSCDDGKSIADMMRRYGPEMAAMHRAHHGAGDGAGAGMGAMHGDHHGEDAAEDEGMMDGGGMADMMDDAGHMGSGEAGQAG